MTSTMSVSRIPVPVRNFDDATPHRTISAKTRLERLRDEFQRRLLFEKQAKLHDFYTQKQRRKTKVAAGRQIGSGETRYGRNRNPEATADFFGERDDLGKGHQNRYTSPNSNFPNMSGRFHRRPQLPPYPKRSAGRDRAHLLAPINPARPNQGRELQETEDASLAPSPDFLSNTYTIKKQNLEPAEVQKLAPRPPPIVSRPKIMRPYVRNRTHQVQFHNEGRGEGQFDQPNLERVKQERLRQLNEEVSDEPNHSLQRQGDRVLSSPGIKGLPTKTQRASEFQNQERARRLQRLNEKARIQAGLLFHEESGGDGDGRRDPEREQSEIHTDTDDDNNDNEYNENEDSEKEEDEVWRQKQQILQHHNRKEARLEVKVSDEEEDVEDERLKQKERELQELIRRQEEELQKLRLEKFEEEAKEVCLFSIYCHTCLMFCSICNLVKPLSLGT